MAEIRRLGNHVQHIDGLVHAADDQYTEVMGAPADDNHKWFVSVISTRGCAACARLKADLKNDEYLRALVTLAEGDDRHSDTKTSWAHFNLYDAQDRSQQFRWEKLKIAGYPTILVQPPINKKYGDPATVVAQITGYDGDGKKLATRIAAAIKLYLVKQAQRQANRGHRALHFTAEDAEDAEAEAKLKGGWGQDDVGIDPPWTPAPKVDPMPTPGPFPGPAPGPLDVLPPLFNIPPSPITPPKPAEPKPDEPKPNGKIAATPEAIVVYDCQTELTAEQEGRIQGLISRLRGGGRILRVRPVDLKDSPVAIPKDQLPAVIVTADGQVQDRISARLFPLLNPPAEPPRAVGIADLPWSSILALVTTGFSIPAALPLIIWGIRFVRARRAAAGKQIFLSDDMLAWLAANGPAIQQFIEQFVKKPAPTPPPGG